MTHPLHGFSVSLHNMKCFGPEGSGFFNFAPITLVIGRNNSGKSSVLDFLESATDDKSAGFEDRFRRSKSENPSVLVRCIGDIEKLSNALSSMSLKQNFSRIGGRGYAEKNLSCRELTWRIDSAGQVEFLPGDDFPDRDNEELKRRISSVFEIPIRRKMLYRISAERDIVPEVSSKSRGTAPSGLGITNLIRAYINSRGLERDAVEKSMLKELNEIYAGDAFFTRISVQEDEADSKWEVHLREEEKGDIRLSQSGSALKTILSLLTATCLNTHEKAHRLGTNSILCIEELENNLHPGLLRRTLEYLAADREKNGYSLVLTTHSPVCIDWSSRREDCTIIHVTHSNGVSTCRNALTHLSKTSALDDLDVRGSDILQSNGIIWIEGPSDRIYIRKWIEILSGGEIKEGVHYTFMFYGGRILSHFAAAEEQEKSQRISMITANRNVAIVMDSDIKTSEEIGNLNETKRRLLREVEQVNGFAWVTAGKEIENYVSESIWSSIAGKKVRIANERVNVPALHALKSIYRDKVSLAEAASKQFTLETMSGVLDLETQVSELCSRIRRWNSLK